MWKLNLTWALRNCLEEMPESSCQERGLFFIMFDTIHEEPSILNDVQSFGFDIVYVLNALKHGLVD